MEGGKSAERAPQGCTEWMQNISPAVQTGLRPCRADGAEAGALPALPGANPFLTGM